MCLLPGERDGLRRLPPPPRRPARRPGPRRLSGPTAVKRRSKMVKYYSNNGQIIVKRWSTGSVRSLFAPGSNSAFSKRRFDLVTKRRFELVKNGGLNWSNGGIEADGGTTYAIAI